MKKIMLLAFATFFSLSATHEEIMKAVKNCDTHRLRNLLSKEISITTSDHAKYLDFAQEKVEESTMNLTTFHSKSQGRILIGATTGLLGLSLSYIGLSSMWRMKSKIKDNEEHFANATLLGLSGILLTLFAARYLYKGLIFYENTKEHDKALAVEGLIKRIPTRD